MAVTGLNGSRCGADALGLPLCTVSELDAIGCGGLLPVREGRCPGGEHGHGTTFVLARNGAYTHLGGTGIGGGTLMGLGRGLLGVHTPDELFQLADEGDLGQVDLRIGDLFGGLGDPRPQPHLLQSGQGLPRTLPGQTGPPAC